MVRSSGIGPGERAVPPRGELDELAAQEGLQFDRGLGAVAEPQVAGDAELDQYLRPVEADGRHPPDTGTRDLHDAVGLQAARLSEVRRVFLVAGEER